MHIHELHKMADPRLPFIFHRMTRLVSHPASVFNWHENVEIISVVKGRGYVLVGEERILLREGEITVIPPNRLHAFSASEGEEMCYRCLIIDRSFLSEHHFSGETSFLQVIRDDAVFSDIEAFDRFWTMEESTCAWRVQHLRLLALQIYLCLAENYAARDSVTAGETHVMAAVKEALGFIRAEYARDISLDAIARYVGMSKYYFAREFRRITGLSVVAYLNAVRCERAKRLLTEGEESIGNVGALCGFPNASYFTQTFREQVGCTPTQYRRRQTAGEDRDVAF